MNNALRVLLLDDDPDDRMLVVHELRREFPGVHVEQFGEPLDLDHLLEKSQFDLVITDYRLHWTDGLAILRAVKARHPYCPVIMFTGTGNEETAVEAMKAGLDDYVIKSPKHFIRLCASVKLALEKARQRLTLRKAEKDLRLSEEKFAILFCSSPDAILLTAISDGRIIDANNSVYHITGYKPEEVIGRTNSEMDWWTDPADRERYVEMLQKQGRVVDMEAVFRAKSGEIKIGQISGELVDIRGNKHILSIFRDITERKQMEEERTQNAHKLVKAMESTIEAMATTVEMRDPYTAGHQRRVTVLASAIAREMCLSEDQVYEIGLAGIVHDVGKISVPAEILNKPVKLSKIEFDLIKIHPEVGYNILKDIQFPWPIALTILQHHERMDGSGYPAGLSKEAILLEARILAVADVVEAIASHRPYRSAIGLDGALEEISMNSGILYDADVVDVCVRLFHEKGFNFK